MSRNKSVVAFLEKKRATRLLKILKIRPSLLRLIIHALCFFQRLQPSLRRLLDQAKENIDVIDFRKPSQRADRDQVRQRLSLVESFSDDRDQRLPLVRNQMIWLNEQPQQLLKRDTYRLSSSRGEGTKQLLGQRLWLDEQLEIEKEI